MTGTITSICVYCGSSRNPQKIYEEAAIELGNFLAQHKIQLVYGGGKSGLMGVVAETCLKAKGQVTGVMTDFLLGYEGVPDNLTELILLPTMHARKKKMFDLSQGFVVLPGGLGTLDEAFEILTWRQVGLHSKPIVFVNIKKYWDPLLKKLIPHMITENFVRPTDKNLFSCVDRIDHILEMLEREPYANKDFVSKWG